MPEKIIAYGLHLQTILLKKNPKEEMKVMKFGGTSVGKPERMIEIKKLITKDDESKVVVLSALSGTTNSLSEISHLLAKGDRV
ncbi:MAG TPA: hypothetical protein VJ279_05375, partial [Hanamia sp.]|nr:hypothetical protein [Hanamia sp.]